MSNKQGFSLNRLGYLSMILLIILSISCSKSNTGGGGSTTSSITGFSFQTSANPIPVNSTGNINGSNILVFLPPSTNTNALVPSFSLSDSAVVTVNGVKQQSGVTQVNFSQPVTYTVTTVSGNIQTYTITLITGLSAIDQNVSAFMKQYNIPALSIAITLNEKLVYAQSYGVSNLNNNTTAKNNNLYRISSLSKQLTSAAIMKLMDQGKINMSDKVFGPGAILGTAYGTQPYTNWLSSVTVGQLLQHTEGGWLDDNTDPLGQNPNMSVQQIISWGIDNVPLLYPPGSSFNYSHFGYVILGRVIEQITGQTYQQAINSLVLQPSGISDMQIAGNTQAQQLPNEVTYYPGTNIDPYSFNISRMDAANGWLASATDLAKFLVHVDGLSSQTILSSNAITVMSTPSAINHGYACGWEVNPYNWFHHGNLPGTGTSQAITTQSGNFNYVILTNSNSSDPNFSGNMDNIFWNAIGNISNWPTYDLFQSQQP